MKKIGLIGGMSWESSAEYYRLLNTKIKDILGGFHSCHCIMESVDFAEIETLQHDGKWQELEKMMVAAAKNLEKAGAELVVLCTNTMHMLSEAIVKNVSVPFLHIATATGEAIKQKGLEEVLLLGTRFTMEQDFYRTVLDTQFDVRNHIPNSKDRQEVHRIIYDELVHGVISDISRKNLLKIIGKGINKGAQGVILGCTEIPLIIKQKDVEIPVFDTTEIHVDKALEFALG